MSLFQFREWWSASPDKKDEFHIGSMFVCNIDNDPIDRKKIVTASINGVIRIYCPSQGETKVEDLLLEKDLKLPILQIDYGFFISNSKQVALAVLHPRKIRVYTIDAVGGYGSSAKYFEFTQLYVHDLGRAASNFTKGGLGGARKKDFLCVQSLDGEISIFEQERLAFKRRLSDFLIPGPIFYVFQIDSLLTVNAAMMLQCYKYQVLSASGDNVNGTVVNQGGAEGFFSKKQVTVDWAVNLGDSGLQVGVARFTPNLPPFQIDIIALCERSIFAISEQGVMRWQSRLDYEPSCFTTYTTGDRLATNVEQRSYWKSENIIIASHLGHLNIYSTCNHIWSATTMTSPVAIAVGDFSVCNCMQVAMDENGRVVVGYLGTDPALSSPVITENDKDVDYNALEQEGRALNKIIRDYQTNKTVEPDNQLSVSVDIVLDNENQERVVEEEWEELPGTANCSIKLLKPSESAIENAVLSIITPKAVIAQQTSLKLDAGTLFSGEPQKVSVRFRIIRGTIPETTNCTAVAGFFSDSGVTRATTKKFRLPITMLCRGLSPVKNNLFMFTLRCSIPPVPPIELFKDVFDRCSDGDQSRTSNAVCLQLYGSDAKVTLLLSKKGGKLRVQSGSFEALWLVTAELLGRLSCTHQGIKFEYSEALPLQDYFSSIEKHWLLRQEIKLHERELERLAHEYRVVQKRLLTRFKDKNAQPLRGLDIVLREVHGHIMELSRLVEEKSLKLRKLGNSVACATQLILLLIRVKYDLDNTRFSLLKAHLNASVLDPIGPDNQGWEECIDCSMTHLLRTSLAKSSRDTAVTQQTMEEFADISKLKRHIKIVIDRVKKESEEPAET